MNIKQWITLTGYHHWAHLHVTRDITLTQGIILNLLLDIITGIGTCITDPDPSHILADIKVTVMITCTEAIPDHIIDALTEAPHITITPAFTIIAMTHPIGDQHHV